MSNIVYVFLDTIVQIITMCIVERKILVKKDKKIVLAVALLAGVGFLFHDSFFSEFVYFVLAIVVSYILCKPNTSRFAITYMVALILEAVLEAIVTFLIPNNMLEPVAMKGVMIFVMLIFGAVNNFVIKKNFNFEVVPKKLLLGIAIMLFALIFVMSGIMMYTEHMDDTISKALGGATIIVCLAVVGIALQSISAQISKMNLEREKDMLQSYNEQQKKYYELVLKSEEDTRRFRHDMMNHMFCLENYLEEGKIDECREYIANITNSLNYSRKKIYHTGNKVSDVMLTNILENKKDDVAVSVTGRLKEDIPISDFDLCIVVSNIVKNAVEAVNKQSDESNKYIKINFTMGKRFLRIEERNSIDEKQVENAKKFETAKEDKRAHGLGVKNVKMIVEKYNGTFKSEVHNKEFYVCVEMDMKTKI